MIFADMLGADYLSTSNSQNSVSSIDELLSEIGGTYYSDCYTPAPDTPRSSACMWSGLYPKANGCDNRLKYPGSFLNTEATFWKSLRDNGYEINAYVKTSMNRIGLLPHTFEKCVKYTTFSDFLDKTAIKENSLTFLYFPDLHLMMDINGYNKKRFQEGSSIVADNIKRVFKAFPIDSFDYVVLFSDHGFRVERKKHLIDDDRVKTLMFLHKKGDKAIRIDKQLRSNLDVCPTILDIIGASQFDDIDGISLLSEQGHEYILIEDHQDFSVKLGQTIEHWAVVRGDGKHWLECSGKWEHEKSSTGFNEEYWEEMIIRKMSDYESNRYLYQTLHKYDDYKLDNDRFSDGTQIKTRITRGKVFRMLNIIKKAFRI